MSADNFLALRLHEPSGKYVVTHESASADELSDLDREYNRITANGGSWYLSGVFDTWLDAFSFLNKCYEDEPYIEYGPSICVEQPKWENSNIQFPRLIAEIVATQEIDMEALAESMDLTLDDVHELFERAQTEWEQIKEKA
jgi:hypothetical protein